jgi:hypothetical protein
MFGICRYDADRPSGQVYQAQGKGVSGPEECVLLQLFRETRLCLATAPKIAAREQSKLH